MNKDEFVSIHETIRDATNPVLLKMLCEIPLEGISMHMDPESDLLWIQDKVTQNYYPLTLEDDLYDSRAIILLWRATEAIVQFGCQLCQYGWVHMKHVKTDITLEVSGSKCGCFYCYAVFNNQDLDGRRVVGNYCGGTQAEALAKVAIGAFQMLPWVLTRCAENHVAEEARWHDWHKRWEDEKLLAAQENREPNSDNVVYRGKRENPALVDGDESDLTRN